MTSLVLNNRALISDTSDVHEVQTSHSHVKLLLLSHVILHSSYVINSSKRKNSCRYNLSSTYFFLLQHGLSEPEFYGDLAYELKLENVFVKHYIPNHIPDPI